MTEWAVVLKRSCSCSWHQEMIRVAIARICYWRCRKANRQTKSRFETFEVALSDPVFALGVAARMFDVAFVSSYAEGVERD